MALAPTPDPKLDAITDAAAALFDVPIALISFTGRHDQWVKSAVGCDAISLPRGWSPSASTLENPDSVLLIPDARLDPRFRDTPLVTGAPHMVFYAGHAIHSPTGEPIGAICIIDVETRRWTIRDGQRLASLARWAEMELALTSTGRDGPEGLTGLEDQDAQSLHRSRFWQLSRAIFCISDERGHLLDENGRLSTLLGYQSEAMLHRPILDVVHPLDRLETQLFIESGASGPFINRLRAADGSYRRIEWYKTNFGAHVYAVANDVTERERNARDLSDAHTRLQQKNLELQEFAGFIAHEFRSPVAAIGMLSDFVQGDDEVIVALRQGAHRLQEIVDAISRVYEVRPNAAKTRLPQDAIRAQVPPGRAAIDWRPGPDILGDASQIQQLFGNLFTNAGKYCHPDRPAKVTVTSHADQGRIQFSVTDNGIGVGADDVERIFHPFERLKQEGAGHGLGLTLCRRIVEAHGGRLQAVSAKGGTTFQFDLPGVAA